MPIVSPAADSFQLERTLRLPQSVEWFLTRRRFPFTVEKSACAASAEVKGRRISLAIASQLKPYLDNFAEDHVEASVAEVSEAAMQFYQTEESPSWPAQHYADKLHMLRYDIGLAFDVTSENSIAQVRQDVFHGEARKPIIELLGYGLTVLTSARLLKLSADRFVFLRGAESRPDFAATIKIDEVVAKSATTAIITKEGFKIGIESKARGQHQGFFVTRGKSRGQPNDVLSSLLEKCGSQPDGVGFLGFLVTTQTRNDDGTGETRLALVDPGEPQALPEQQQVVLLLRGLMVRLRRIGAWGTLHRASNWLIKLGDTFSPDENFFLSAVPQTDAFLPREQHLGHPYIGRIFSDVLHRLGPTRRPQITRAEIQRRLTQGDAGPIWYHGVSEIVVGIIARQDAASLLSFGVGENSPLATIRLPYRDDLSAGGVLSILRQAVAHAT